LRVGDVNVQNSQGQSLGEMEDLIQTLRMKHQPDRQTFKMTKKILELIVKEYQNLE
jgi:hypothetical protein